MCFPKKNRTLRFPAMTLKFRITAKSTIILPSYKGAAFRGAFENAFRFAVCTKKARTCDGCELGFACLYKAVFRPNPPAHLKHSGKFENPPVPYALVPPLTTRRVIERGEQTHFELVLFGYARDALPLFVQVFQNIGKRGIGRHRGGFFLDAVTIEDGKSDGVIYDRESNRVLIRKTDCVAIEPEENEKESVHVSLVTPLRIKAKGKLVTKLDFTTLFETVARRIELLDAIYGSGEFQVPEDLLEKAKSVETVSDAIRWYDWGRFSTRQKREMRFGGMMGDIRFKGELGRFMPILELGRHVGAGQATTFGLGRYELC